MENTVILDKEYCWEFDEKRKNAIITSYHKYGPSKDNFQKGMVDAIGSLKKNLQKFEETGNTEYLVDVANYAMFRFMYPMKGEEVVQIQVDRMRQAGKYHLMQAENPVFLFSFTFDGTGEG